MHPLTPNRTANYKPWLFAFCVFSLCWITLLLYAGGFTTTVRAGMAFLDWPLSNGSLNPENWSFDVGIHFAHRVGAVVVTVSLLTYLSKLWAHTTTRKAFLGGILRSLDA